MSYLSWPSTVTQTSFKTQPQMLKVIECAVGVILPQPRMESPPLRTPVPNVKFGSWQMPGKGTKRTCTLNLDLYTVALSLDSAVCFPKAECFRLWNRVCDPQSWYFDGYLLMFM